MVEHALQWQTLCHFSHRYRAVPVPLRSSSRNCSENDCQVFRLRNRPPGASGVAKLKAHSSL
jgi:hypothetical protein